MKLIIDIPDEMYNNICWGVNAHIGSFTDKCIANGTPLKDEVMIATLMSLVTDKDYKPKLEGEDK